MPPPSGYDPSHVQFRIEDLLESAAFPHAVTQLRLRETHISWVVLTGSFAYKIKKPVRYDFLDASTLERRHALCAEELRLNRRFAPDLYLDVVPIAREAGRLKIDGHGAAVEYAVRMHEFDPSQELSELLAQHAVTANDLKIIASRLADLHRQAAVASADSTYGTCEQVRTQLLENLTPLRAHLRGSPVAPSLDRLERWTGDSLARLQATIAARKHDGWVRECHGDLHARNVVRWKQQWLPFDCLEFDPALRWIDVMSDVAFLFMDLVAHRREDLAHEFLNRYLEETGDYAGLRLLPLYAAYRALVRAKVDALGAAAAGPETRRALEARLAGRLEVAVRFMDASPPALILMHGVTACGKSWLSERLIPAISAVRIRSDLERKRLAGVASLSRRIFGVGEGAYTEQSRQQTYTRLLECAEAALEGACSVIVDASFLKATHRAQFLGLAARRHCRVLIASCRADVASLQERLDTRARSGLDPSEATRAVLEEQLRTEEPLTGNERQHAVEIDTGSLTSADAGIAAIKARLQI